MLRNPIEKIFSLYNHYRKTSAMRHPTPLSNKEEENSEIQHQIAKQELTFEQWVEERLETLDRILAGINPTALSWRQWNKLLLWHYHNGNTNSNNSNNDNNNKDNIYISDEDNMDTPTPLHALWQREIPKDMVGFLKALGAASAASQWHQHWGQMVQKSQIKVVTYDRYMAEPIKVMKEVQRFLGVEKADWKRITRKRAALTKEHEAIIPKKLVELFKPLNDQLSKTFEIDLSAWNS